MTSALRSGPEPPVGSMLQDVIDNVHRMVRSEMTPKPMTPPHQVEGNWVVGVIGRRPRPVHGRPRLILVEHVPRGRNHAGVPPGAVPARAVPLSGAPGAGPVVHGGIRVRGAVLAITRPDVRELVVDPRSIERRITTHEEPMTVVTDWRDREATPLGNGGRCFGWWDIDLTARAQVDHTRRRQA